MQNFLREGVLFFQQNEWVSYLLVLWTIPWKGLALWKSSKKNQIYWFVAFLLVNTLGILEILYLYVFSKMEKGKVEEAAETEVKEEAEPAEEDRTPEVDIRRS